MGRRKTVMTCPHLKSTLTIDIGIYICCVILQPGPYLQKLDTHRDLKKKGVNSEALDSHSSEAHVSPFFYIVDVWKVYVRRIFKPFSSDARVCFVRTYIHL